jgi:tetratricopeptide (TPR) repeat protein
VAAVAVAAVGVWFLLRPRDPEPPVLHAQDGADPAFVQAVEDGRRAVLADRRSPEKWGDLGMTFAAHGAEVEANACFAAAERLEPGNPRWPYLQALFASTHQPGEAEPYLRRALELDGHNAAARAAARLKLAELLLEDNRLDESESLFSAQLKQTPADARARLGLAQVALARGDRDRARERFRQLIGDPFANKKALIQLAALARAAGDAAEAAKYEDAARTAPADLNWVDPHLSDVHKRSVSRQGRLREAERLEAAGQLPQAAQIRVELAQADPSPRLLTAAAMDLLKLKEYRQAEELLRECLRVQPGHSQAEYFLAVTLFERAEAVRGSEPELSKSLLREAIEHARAAVDSKPDLGLAWLYLGRAMLDLGENRAGAVEPLRQAVACRPEFVDTHLYLGEALLAAGNPDEAIREARNAAELAKPGDARPRQLLMKLGVQP